MSKPLFLYIAHQAVHVANSEAPLQAPLAFIDKYNAKILDEKRRHYAAMVRETFKKPNIDSLLQWNRIPYAMNHLWQTCGSSNSLRCQGQRLTSMKCFTIAEIVLTK